MPFGWNRPLACCGRLPACRNVRRQVAAENGLAARSTPFQNTLLAFALAFAATTAHAKLNVVATLPDFGAIAEEIGGDKVKVTSIARGTEDAHFVDARPSFIRVLNQADVLLEGGLDLEIGWLPPLLNAARNAKILHDAPGHVILSRGITVLEVPSGPVDRSMGDVHPSGNPHCWLDPANGKVIAASAAAAFARLDPPNAAFYEANLKTFNQRLDAKLAEWTKRMEPLRGLKVVTYHKSFSYFLERFGLELAGTIEPKPGIEPSPTHINALIPRAKEEGVKLVLVEPCRPRKTPEYVAGSIGAKLLILPTSVGGNAKVKDYIDLFDYDIGQIVEALKP
ncbi:MAG: zinc ABC transporter substrate-binding protein [Verrucomicrobia bacterium]|nr:zinc ABC transporter substrate-binding protein [Verrucomicrobiota bacterium]